ncbi:transmembrane protein 161A isoform X1 [Monodon monoceros]|uniref:transmembrane protein 161A isoform X1 n=2 Tax=Monodon monoceros TaxID=40151 RepID=UPI0010F4F50D|nr:transmembrane protein 161A isoform X1 [Monodon monoceros]
MAVLGVQLVVTLLTATLMHRLAPHCSFARWLLCNGSLFRYKHPSEEELRALAGKQRPRGRKERWANGYSEDKPLSVPRDTPFQLETCPLTAVDALVLRFFLEYQWFVDFAVYSGGVYLFTEAYYYVLGPAKETNIAVFWCLLTIAFSIKVFLTVTRLYFSAEEGGERSVCLTFAFLFLLLAMLVHVVPEETLELGLEPGLASMTQNLEPLLKTQGWDWALPLVKLAIRMGLAAVGSMLGAFLTFPGLRLAQTHHDALTMSEDRPMLQLRGGPGGWSVRAPREGAGGDGGCPSLPALRPCPQVPSAHQLPVPPVCPVALDQAHGAGIPAPGSLWEHVLFSAVRLGLRLAASLDAGGTVPAAAGGDPAPPAGLPVPCQGSSGAAAAGGRPHRGPRDPTAGGAGVLLRDSCEPAVPDSAHPHTQLHAAAQDAGRLLLGPGSRPPAVPHPVLSPRWPGRPRGGRGPADRGPDRRGPGQPAHATLPPRRPLLPHLVDRHLPTALQPLRPVLPPASGGLLARLQTLLQPQGLVLGQRGAGHPLSVPRCNVVLGVPDASTVPVPFTACLSRGHALDPELLPRN